MIYTDRMLATNVIEVLGAKLLAYLTKECEGEAVS